MTMDESLIKLRNSKVLIVGAHTVAGELAIDLLLKAQAQKFWVLDLFPPDIESSAYTFIQMDLTAPGADARLADTLREIQVDTVIHALLKNNPSLNSSAAHELEVIGTLHLAGACKAAEVKKFILCSSTVVYGASPKNPNYIDESKPLASGASAHFVRDKVEAEKLVLQMSKDVPAMEVQILRFGLTVGRRSQNYFTELFRRPIVPTLLGYDPLMQFIHEDDAEEAIRIAMTGNFRGVFNIVGHGVIPLSYALREAGKIRIPVAPFIAYPLIQALWNLQLVPVPGKLLDFFRYLWVADGSKARSEMQFTPHLSSKDAFLSFTKERQNEGERMRANDEE